MSKTEHKYEPGDIVYYDGSLYLVDSREGPLTWNDEGVPTYLIVKVHGSEPGPYYLDAALESDLSY